MSKSNPAYRKNSPATEYVTKQIAAKRLGLSVRRVLELSARGHLKRRTVVDPGTKRRQTVFRAEDVDRAVVDGQHRLFSHYVDANVLAALPPPQPVSAPPAVPDTPWLTVDEAAAYSGLPASFLLSLIVEKRRLPALDVGVRAGGRYRVARRDLEAIRGVLHTKK